MNDKKLQKKYGLSDRELSEVGEEKAGKYW